MKINEIKKIEAIGHITPFTDHYPKNGYPILICHVKQSNEHYITLIQGCIEIISQHPIK